MSIMYGTPLPCGKCGARDSLWASHSFGAKVVCPCGEEGPFIKGTNYQDEEFYAVFAWNDKQKSRRD